MILYKQLKSKNKCINCYVDKVVIDNISVNIGKDTKLQTVMDIFGNLDNLTVYYVLDNKTYIIMYSREFNTQEFPLPIYECDLSTEKKAFDMTDDSIILFDILPVPSIVFTEKERDDILRVLRSLSGPKGNFYKDLGYNVDKFRIISLINRDLGLNIDKLSEIELLYSDGSQHKF